MHTPLCPLGHLALTTAAALALAACSGAGAIEEPAAGGHGGGGRSASAGDQGGGAEGGGGLGGAGQGGAGQGGAGGEVQCVDECPAPNGGIQVGCKTRFMYGINYAWHHFAGDFGGIAAWGQGGVSTEASTHAANLADMRAHGAGVVRWWMLPELRGESVVLDANDDPTGLGATTERDVEKALELAEQADVHLMLCLFSFDAFRPTRVEGDLRIVGIRPIVTDARRRAMLMDNVVRPLARAVERSPYRHRMVAWDVINEPEWAITGPSPYDDPDYDPMAELETVTHAEMETFVNDTIRVLRTESRALITVGAAAMKWSSAWSRTDIDFYTFHMYDWINLYWPFNQSPADYGITDKPVVMGEFPVAGLSTATVPEILQSWFSQGYAGALSWAYNGATAAELETIKAFADERPCEASF
ncbi:uncharacterized protein SOCEGT47_024530 [Sorangium cellulosum]|uniref:Glycoside hydrolase family 5 domain-containing protein n=1 Tax=Sorangium cellulosum TaxID=56 RepID=A0A4P2PYJ1_SORCE|nr:hypothetical protein [Sorangium cellulosum]AUX21955.1 uncharacterized protein SOCEGT47_024530 [Sorangium cellulosum]